MKKLQIIVRVQPRTCFKNINSFYGNFSLIARKVITNSLLLITFCLLLITPVFAQGDGIGQSQITPASPFYFLKSVREILELKFAGTTQVRAYRELEFATRRIREVKSLAGTTHQDLIQPTLEKYWFHLGELKSVLNLGDENWAEQASNIIVLHMNALQSVYNQVSEATARRSIRTAVNRLSEWDQTIIDRLNSFNKYPLAQKMMASKLSACRFLSKEASSSALNEIERVVLSEKAQKCLTPSQ